MSWLARSLLSFTFGRAWNSIGWGLFVLGSLLIIVSGGFFKSAGTTLNPNKMPTKLVTKGLYRATRNPMYLGMLTSLIGFALAMNSPLGVIFSIVFLLTVDTVVIPSEERALENIFGGSYLDYKSRTRRWI
ncbi:MAG: hypothetical protein A2070_01095 [Bdellovibrionales bacterium GWC1_52_8]|nr:MAG: hypothetical protein A2Z97_03600 [Bdellovibrionales bacterium GWB1_52_6]OFZ04185.1 MAG: hypothetical protein A2X97_14550 [Bdellovibrionales bacterium GWA1_52_35]OFZ39775.1 MAG: hypothetical protein A2070_01095 [Bdellovibrionales bacterium GWC1_52_8]